MSLVSHAKEELTRAGLFDSNSDYGGMLGEAVMKMIETFSEEGHSGMSAGMAINLFYKLARFEPITPLTGEDDEWVEVGRQNGKTLYQNKRCGRVFREGSEFAYDIDGKVFRKPSGVSYTNSDSRVEVTFPYVPKTEYIDVEE